LEFFFYLTEVVDILLSHDRTLVEHAYRAAIIASRLGKFRLFIFKFEYLFFSGHDKCLEALLNYGMDPNITDRTKITPLHVAYVKKKTVVYWRYKSSLFLFSVRSMKLSTVRILIANSADPNIINNRGETAVAIAEHLQSDQQQNFINALAGKYN
jgi:ankyrin repeat protein